MPIIEQSAVKPDFPNVFTLEKASPRVTHVRLRIYPDGGVARLRIYGDVLAEDRTFWRPGSVDLGAVENGGTIAAKSDEFFGPPANMLLPGRGVNMGDGWETKRRRTPGSDWAVVKLARRGILERIELDTHFFKGNAPQAALIEARGRDGHARGRAERCSRPPRRAAGGCSWTRRRSSSTGVTSSSPSTPCPSRTCACTSSRMVA